MTRIDAVSGLTAVSVGVAVRGRRRVDGAGNALTSTRPTAGATAWTRTRGVAGGLTASSCPTASLCVAVDAYGDAVLGTRLKQAWQSAQPPPG